jgi:A/G-specific adenine glycosylase
MTRTSPNPSATYRRLQRWFAHHARTLPWRGETNPYRIWISEIMLVQTTAAVAIKRYPRFLKRFPNIKSLAQAPLDAVLKEWEGLGYYHRARFLHQAAQIIATRHRGRFPRTYDEIRALPGVGDYCAAAIYNFSFGGRAVAVDANIARVAARLFKIPGDIRSSRARAAIHHHLAELMRTGRGAIWTDGLIEVGARICLPRKPDCAHCPLRQDCLAYRSGNPTRYGLPVKKPVRREVAVACGIIRRADGRILIAQRPEHGLLPGLWEFPGGKRNGNEKLSETCRREIAEELGISVTVGERRTVIRHAYSHYTVRLHVFECRYLRGRPHALGCQRWRWVRLRDLSRYAFPTANRAVISELQRETEP